MDFAFGEFCCSSFVGCLILCGMVKKGLSWDELFACDSVPAQMTCGNFSNDFGGQRSPAESHVSSITPPSDADSRSRLFGDRIAGTASGTSPLRPVGWSSLFAVTPEIGCVSERSTSDLPGPTQMWGDGGIADWLCSTSSIASPVRRMEVENERMDDDVCVGAMATLSCDVGEFGGGDGHILRDESLQLAISPKMEGCEEDMFSSCDTVRFLGLWKFSE